MEKIRKPFEGVWNIIRFNWHFYVWASVLVLLLSLLSCYVKGELRVFLIILISMGISSILISLVVSFYIYDVSGLYKLKWLDGVVSQTQNTIVNINAGFDETSGLLKQKFPQAQLIVLDFYNPEKHTEISIKRARKAYPPFAGTQQTTTASLPLKDNAAETIFVILAAHEIRNKHERIDFFKELKRILKPDGQIVITEHLRDAANFIAFNIGFLHFFSNNSWRNIFQHSGLTIQQTAKITPFMSTFILTKNGNAL